MKILKRILLGLLILIVLLLIIGFFLPGKAKVERSLVMKASPEIIFAQINDVHNWPKWSPFHKMDTAMKIKYTGNPIGGNGSGYEWEGNSKVGKGSLEITKSEDGKRIDMDLNFDGMDKAFGYFTFEKVEGGTKVTWGMETSDVGWMPWKRWMILFMDKFLGPTFNDGLKALDELTAKMKSERMSEVRQIKLDAMDYLAINDTCSGAEIPAHLGNDFGTIGMFAQKNEVNILLDSSSNLHRLFGIWYGDGSASDKWIFQACAFTSTEIKKIPQDKIVKAHHFAAGNYLMVKFWGAYENTKIAHDAIRDYAKKNNLEITSAPWEVYVDDPQGKDPNDVETDIYYAVGL